MPDTGRLVVRSGGRVVSMVPVNKPVITIGREPSNDISLPDSRVSRHHAELRQEPGGLALTDLGSLNGTFLNEGERMPPHQPLLLSSGQTLTINPFVIAYQGVEQFQRRDDAFAGEQAQPAEAEAVEEMPPPPPRPPMPDRQRMPIPAPAGPRSRYMRHLPIIFQDSDFLGRYLMILEALWEPLEQREDHIDLYFDARTAPAGFLPWLADWMGLTVNEHWPEGRVRDFVREATDLYRWRGTRYGMMRMIEVATGLYADVTDDPTSTPCTFRVAIQIPEGFEVDNQFIETLIEANKPAHTGYTLDIHS